MDKQNRIPAGDGRHGVTENALDEAARLCAAFSHASVLGFAILDDRLRYQTINDALAAINGLPAAAHLGNSIRDLFGSHIADQIEPGVKRLITTARTWTSKSTPLCPPGANPVHGSTITSSLTAVRGK